MGTTSTSPVSVQWDVDGDLVADFEINNAAPVGYGTIFLHSDGLNGQGVVQLAPNTAPDDIRNLPLSVTIGSTLSGSYRWGSGGQNQREIAGSATIRGNADGLIFGDNFIGFRFAGSGTTLYGWARINLQKNPAIPS